MRKFIIVVMAGLAGASCHEKKEEQPAPVEKSLTPLAAALPVEAGAPGAEPVCAPLDASKIAPFATCTTKVVKIPVPEIEDETGSLAPFYRKVAQVERKEATKPLRIGMYGDSNLTSDFISGHLRRVLQARWGDAGHGWISLSRPWGSYRHEDVSTGGMWNLFKQWAPTTHVCPDKEYGFANMAAESNEIGAAGWAGTTKNEKAEVGKAVTQFELHYLKQKGGGSLRVEIDKKDIKTISTKTEGDAKFELGVDTFPVDEGPHEIRVFVRGDGKVRIFGTSLDRFPAKFEPEKPGVQLDSLGAGALNYERLTWVANDVRKPGLQKRNYDLVILWLGMNVMFVPPNEGYAKSFLHDLKDALPGVPILIMSPSDTAKDGDTKSDPRIVQVIDQMRKVAKDEGVAFWDFREAMGGDGAVIGFTKRGLTGEDHIHFGPEGSKLMGDRFLCSFTNAYSAFIAKNPEAGCRAATDAGP
jgi:lysophospholipase L1-like esterase